MNDQSVTNFLQKCLLQAVLVLDVLLLDTSLAVWLTLRSSGDFLEC